MAYISQKSQEVTGDFCHAYGHRVTGSLAVWTQAVFLGLLPGHSCKLAQNALQ